MMHKNILASLPCSLWVSVLAEDHGFKSHILCFQSRKICIRRNCTTSQFV